MSDEAAACKHCGAFGGIPHGWVEGDCILPHRAHSRKLHEGTHVCDPCVDRWDEWLAEIVELWAGLTDVLLAGSIPEAESEHQKPRKAPASPSPLRLLAWALAHPRMLNAFVDNGDGTITAGYLGGNVPNVPDVLTNWAEAVWDANGWGSGWPNTVSGAAAAVRAHRAVIAALPDVDTFDADVRWVRRSLRQAHGISNPTPLGACLSVDCGGNVWPNPGGQPRCDRCGRRYGTHDLVRLKLNEKQAAS